MLHGTICNMTSITKLTIRFIAGLELMQSTLTWRIGRCTLQFGRILTDPIARKNPASLSFCRHSGSLLDID